MHAEVGAVRSGAINEIEAEGFAFEDAGVFGEKAEEDADKEAFELMAGVAADLEGVVEAAHVFDRFDVDGTLLDEFVLLVAGEEGELVDVVAKIGEGKFDGADAAVVEKGKIELVLGFKVVQGDAGEVRNDDVARNLFVAAFAGEVLNVAEGLGFGFAEVLAAAFVFDENDARPKKVNVAVISGKSLDGLLEAGDGAAGNSKDVEELIPEGLLFGLFALRAGPFL